MMAKVVITGEDKQQHIVKIFSETISKVVDGWTGSKVTDGRCS